jgi:hypothetical protein
VHAGFDDTAKLKMIRVQLLDSDVCERTNTLLFHAPATGVYASKLQLEVFETLREQCLRHVYIVQKRIQPQDAYRFARPPFERHSQKNAYFVRARITDVVGEAIDERR